jgi:hypothetical protein
MVSRKLTTINNLQSLNPKTLGHYCYSILKQIRSRKDVADVRVAVMQMEDPEEWPSTDTIWVFTSASADEVRSWFPDRFAPDDMVTGFENYHGSTFEHYEAPNGTKPVGAWYD